MTNQRMVGVDPGTLQRLKVIARESNFSVAGYLRRISTVMVDPDQKPLPVEFSVQLANLSVQIESIRALMLKRFELLTDRLKELDDAIDTLDNLYYEPIRRLGSFFNTLEDYGIRRARKNLKIERENWEKSQKVDWSKAPVMNTKALDEAMGNSENEHNEEMKGYHEFYDAGKGEGDEN